MSTVQALADALAARKGGCPVSISYRMAPAHTRRSLARWHPWTGRKNALVRRRRLPQVEPNVPLILSRAPEPAHGLRKPLHLLLELLKFLPVLPN
jgi:hypothetical protein